MVGQAEGGERAMGETMAEFFFALFCISIAVMVFAMFMEARQGRLSGED